MKTPLISTQPKTETVRSVQNATGNRRGMTLVEMLVATTCTLILMGLVGQLFGVFGNAVSGSREVMQLDAEMRSVAWRLRQDLKGVTAPTLPPLDPDDGQGYFEYIDGPMRDFGLAAAEPPGGAADLNRLFGDCDDVLLFTTRSSSAPFVGKFGSDSIESDTAEVAWFLRPAGNTYSLFRKQLLVVGEVGSGIFSQYGNRCPQITVIEDANFDGIISGVESDIGTPSLIDGPWESFYANYDISARCRPDVALPGFWLTACNLTDLTNRENRFLHHFGPYDPAINACRTRTGAAGQDPLGNDLWYPYMFPTFDGTPQHFQNAVPPPGLVFAFNGPRAGEDVVLTNVIGFDVKAFDPTAPVRATGAGTIVLPGDPGYLVTLASTPAPNPATGCYVDLRYDDRSVAAPTVPGPIDGQGGASIYPSGLWSPFSTVGQRIHSADAANLNMINNNRLTRSGVPQYPVYDTWSSYYESNRLNEDQDSDVDEGVDGLDNDVPAQDGFVDDGPIDLNNDGTFDQTNNERGEQETAPPYPYPLRGIEIRLRCYEPRSRQVRQVTVRHTFVPH
jgi:type II secretory pathway pseudopilin PulG